MSIRKRKQFIFLPGDEVKCICKYEYELVDGSVVRDFTRGRTYIVKEFLNLGEALGEYRWWLQFERDNRGEENGLSARHFKLYKRNGKLAKGA